MSNRGYNSTGPAPCRRLKLFGVDIPFPPEIEHEGEVGGPVISLTYGGQSGQPSFHVPQVQQGHLPTVPFALATQGFPLLASSPPASIDVEDDDVIISSPRAFEEARNNSHRLQESAPVVDLESEEIPERVDVNRGSQRRRLRARRTIIITSDQFVNLEGMEEGNSSMVSAQPVAPPPSPSPPLPPSPPPPVPTFTCPVCMGPLVEEVTTKCGHIFCKGCIKTAIAADPKCPTCRRKVTKRGIIRIYLPTTN